MKRRDPYLEALKAEELRQLRELPENLQADDEFRPTASMWAVVICTGLSVAAILFAVFLEWLAS